MPSGKTHDAITLLLAGPVCAGAFVITRDPWMSGVVTAGFLFGGLMFGPDLDTVSRQYHRWSVFKLLWFPYRSFFSHRSRWSHGLLFGALLRVVYFMGAATCLGFIATYVLTAYTGDEVPGFWEFSSVWARLRANADSLLGSYGILGLFIGMWAGAASHTFTDIAGTYVKTGRVNWEL